ncbi:MAG: hypothetical protein M1827_002376 [Pycnora praestabilis]|nr:MAG: hypothetical protein M1827_002376 [Pycnora praestabilis]
MKRIESSDLGSKWFSFAEWIWIEGLVNDLGRPGTEWHSTGHGGGVQHKYSGIVSVIGWVLVDYFKHGRKIPYLVPVRVRLVALSELRQRPDVFLFGIQVDKQLAEITAISAYSSVVSCFLLYGLKYIPGMHPRVSEEAEMVGPDIDQFFDKHIGDWTMFEAKHGVLQTASMSITESRPTERIVDALTAEKF